MFKKVLIANRGEIAVRVMRTCKRLGIETVAVYSEADKEALHVQLADEAFEIGPPRVHESYLNLEKIIEVAKKTNADAIHPGYGLLSESAEFAKRCQEEGITFVGPDPDIIALMGSKIAARKAMEKAGFPIIPGTDKAVESEDEAIKAAQEIGFPLMLKASAGGGGIGMQLVADEEQLRKAFAGNQKRAQSFFGNGDMFLEKWIEEPRHIEIQLLADQFGHTVHLWERDCSVQRRHQKVIEESPSPFLDDQIRKQMGEMAVAAAKAIGYTNVGTLECLVDTNQQIYFLEMNTRLQVEHPVTEELTGLDLVEWQLKVSAGEEVSFRQHDIDRHGHIIEVRIYAEDPKTFFPSPGTITEFEQPHAPYIRHECAVSKGSVITPFYDPMIAKMIINGSTRHEAISRLADALNEYRIEGIKTNIPLLRDIILHRQYQAGNVTTAFINEHIKKG